MKGSLRQRSPGSWEITVDLGRDPLGRRRRKFATVRGTKARAQRRLRELLSTLDRGVGLPTEKIALREWLERWMDEVVAPSRRQGTKERYREIIDRHIVPHVGGVELGSLGPAHIQRLKAELLKKLSPRSVKQVHIVLSGALKHALRQEMIARNPATLVSPPPSRPAEPETPDVGSVRRALDLAWAENHDMFPVMHLIAYTGLRRGETLGLLWNNVALDVGGAPDGRLGRADGRGLEGVPDKTGKSAGDDAGDVRRRGARLRRAVRRVDDAVASLLDGEAVRAEGGERGDVGAQPAPLPRERRAAGGPEHRRHQQAAGPFERVDNVRHLRPLAPRLAEADRRGLRRRHGGIGSERSRREMASSRARRIWQVLIATARERRTITYGELARAIGRPNLRHVLGSYLDEVAAHCESIRCPRLTVIVVLADTGRPAWPYEIDVDSERERVFGTPWFSVTPIG